jgi:hypothetical protein
MGGPMMQERKILAQFDKNGDHWLNLEERRAAREFLKKEPSPRGGFGPGGPGRGPAGMLTRPLLDALDGNQDGSITKEELLSGIGKFFKDADKENHGSLDEKQLTEALERIVPQRRGPGGGPGGAPPGPGGPGGGPGGPPGGPGGGGPGGFRAFGLGGLLATSILQRADANKDKKITLAELTTAAEALLKEADKNKDANLDEKELTDAVALFVPAPGGPGGFGPPGMRGNREPAKPGPRVSPEAVKAYPGAKLYEPTVLRTLFLDFENKDWELELQEFHGTDVEVPATLTVDGKAYANVGVHFRGMSSYMGVPAGYKRSLNLSLDLADPKQRLLGYKTLNLLNSHEDASMMSAVLYAHIAGQFIPAPKANFVRVVINGECWGVYANVQQFNKEFLTENYKTDKGARWKVRGNPGADGGLTYVGENLDEYRRRYTIKSPDNEKDWKALITLCRTLNETPADKLEQALKPMLDIDGVLWFLALDVVLINNDGYWIRSSDYSVYRDPKGIFHLLPADMNEAFQGAMGFGPPGGPGGRGPGGPGGPGPGPGGPGQPPGDVLIDRGGPPGGPGMGPRGGAGLELDPLVGLTDARKPLRSKLLAVPELKKRYLEHVRTIAEQSLDWKNLGPVVAQYRSLIEKEVEADTRKLESFAAFKHATANEVAASQEPGRRPEMSLRNFADKRRAYLLSHPEIKQLGAASSSGSQKGGEK